MFALRKLVCPKPPEPPPPPPEIENDKDKYQDQAVQYSGTFLFQNGLDKEENHVSSLPNVGNASSDQRESISLAVVQEEQILTADEQDQIVQENDKANDTKRREESRDSIEKNKKYSDDPCNMDTCSKKECSSSTCNRIDKRIDKKRVSDKEIDSSKLTEIINSSIKEAMQTVIKQCAMDNDRVTSPKKKISRERPKIQTIDKSICRYRQNVLPVAKHHENDDEEKYILRKRCYPCEYPRRYEKRPSVIKLTKKHVKESYDGSTISKCHPVKNKVCDKGTKKHSKSPKNVKTDNRRMTGNVNIYICSESNENSKHIENKEETEPCAESCSETITECTNSSCVRTPSVSSCRLMSGIQKRRDKLQDHGSINYFTGRNNRATRSSDSNDIPYEKYENVSSLILKDADPLELSTLSSRSTGIESTMSPVSSTRDGCCCEDTVSSYIEMHRRDLMRFKPKFINYDNEDRDPRTMKIFPIRSDHSEVDDTWIRHRNRCKCCSKENRKYDNRAGNKRRSSFDILHEKASRRKMSKCSCIIEEDEEDQCTNVPAKKESNEDKSTVCKNNLEDSQKRNVQEFSVCKNVNNRGEVARESINKSEDALKNGNEQKKGNIDNTKERSNVGGINGDKSNAKNQANVSQAAILQKNTLKSTPEMSSVSKVSPVLQKSRPNSAVERERAASIAKSLQRNKNGKNERPEISVKKNSKETSEAKEQKEKNVSEEKSRSSFLGRSFKRAMSLVNNKNKVENNVKVNKNAQTENSPMLSKPDRSNNSEKENVSKIDAPINENGIRNSRNTSLSTKQERKISDTTKAIRHENIAHIEPNNRPKSKLQAALASRKTVQPLQEDTKEVKKLDPPKETKTNENIKDTKTEPELVKDETATGDFERDTGGKEILCTKMRFDEEINCPCKQKSFESTVNRCCCCCLPVVDCTCNYTKASTVCVVPKVISQDICTPNFERCCVVDNCECNKPMTCDNCSCKSRDVYRYDVLCIDCNEPKEKCRCRPTYVECRNLSRQPRCNETIICVYCEHPRDKCICRAPILKCSYCGLSRDICKCRELCKGRPIVTDHDGDRKICVTAWTPRPEVRRYFSRNLNDFHSDSIDDCYCRKSHKSHPFNDLPYQRSSAFSDVMSELQQKMSDYTCCRRCKKNPCCCRRIFEKKVDVEDRKGRCYVSTKERHRSRSPEMERAKSPINHRYGMERNAQRRTLVPLARICYSCKASPCRCRKGRTTTKRPRAKCYYCKSCPCTCIGPRDVNKPRSCKCGDSPCRVKEKETVLCGKPFDEARKKSEKVFRTRESSDTCVCPLTKPY